MEFQWKNILAAALLVLFGTGCTGTIYPPGSCGDCNLTAPGNAYPLFDWTQIRGGALPQSYGYAMDDGDAISMEVADGTSQGVKPNEVLVVLAAGPRVTWYKAIVAWNKCKGELPSKVEVVNGSPPDTMKLTRATCQSGVSSGVDSIFFSKAKRLNVHSNMYHLDVNQFWNVMGGKVLTLTWSVDNGAGLPYPPPCSAPCIPLSAGS